MCVPFHMHNGTTQNMMSLLVIICLTVRELRFDLVSLSLTLAGQEVRGFVVSNGYNCLIASSGNEGGCFSEIFPDVAEI